MALVLVTVVIKDERVSLLVPSLGAGTLTEENTSQLGTVVDFVSGYRSLLSPWIHPCEYE